MPKFCSLQRFVMIFYDFTLCTLDLVWMECTYYISNCILLVYVFFLLFFLGGGGGGGGGGEGSGERNVLASIARKSVYAPHK